MGKKINLKSVKKVNKKGKIFYMDSKTLSISNISSKL